MNVKTTEKNLKCYPKVKVNLASLPFCKEIPFAPFEKNTRTAPGQGEQEQLHLLLNDFSPCAPVQVLSQLIYPQALISFLRRPHRKGCTHFWPYCLITRRVWNKMHLERRNWKRVNSTVRNAKLNSLFTVTKTHFPTSLVQARPKRGHFFTQGHLRVKSECMWS